MSSSAPAPTSPPTPAPTLAQKTLRGTLWHYATHYSGRLLVFISTIILARLLTQEDFGVAAYAIVVINILNVFNQFGIEAAVIYHKDEPEIADTAFWLSIGTGIAAYVLAWFAAPLVGAFFQDARAVLVTRVLALTFPILTLSSIHSALLRKDLAFNRRLIPELMQRLVRGVSSILLALASFGAWSLVLGQVIGTIATVISYWVTYHWRPAFVFSLHHARTLLSYGMGISVLNVLAVCLNNVDYLIVGRFLGATALGIYTIAFRIPEFLILQFCQIAAQVVFPMYAKLRDDLVQAQQSFLLTTRYTALLTVPMSLGIALVAEPLVLTVFSAKWGEAIPVMQAIAIYTLFLSLGYNVGDLYKAQGKMSILTQLALVRLAILIPALWWAATGPGTLAAIGWTHAIVALIGGSLQIGVACYVIQTRLRDVFGALFPALLAGVIMAVAVWGSLMLVETQASFVQLTVAMIVGVVSYIGALWWLQRDVLLVAGTALRSALSKKSR